MLVQKLFRSFLKKPSLEIHIPISPTPYFFNMTHYLIASLRRFGGAYKNAKVVLTIGDSEIDDRLVKAHSWLNQPNIEIKWLDKEKFVRDSFFATAIERFCHDFQSDMVLMLDADILIARPFDELISDCYYNHEFAGLIAHVSPFADPNMWQKIYDAAGLGTVSLKHEHTGMGYLLINETVRFCPPYFNLGVLCAPNLIMRRIGQEIYTLLHCVNDVTDTFYRCQVALTLAITKLAIPYRCLPARYNFPNLMAFEALYGQELQHASILHLLADHQHIYKTQLFDDLNHVKQMLARDDLRGINQMAQKVLRRIHIDVCSEQDLAN